MPGLVEQGVAEIVLVAQDLAWYGRDAGEPGSLAPLLRRLDPLRAHGLALVRAALPLPVRGQGPARLDDARAAVGRSVLRPLAAARGAGAVAQHEAVGERRALLRDHRRDPRRRTRRGVPLVVHRRLPGRDRSRSRGAARFPRRRAARLGRLLRVLARGRHCGCGLERRRRGLARVRAAARVFRGAGADHHRGAAPRSSAARSRCSSTASTTTT